MSNLIDNAYTQLNNLTQINADDIQTESINTKTLYINNVLFDPSGIDTSGFVTLSTAQSISNKTFTGTTIFSSIQLNDNLITNNGGTTILNSNLALINFLSGTTTNINTRFTTNETNITALQTKTTNMSFASNTTTFTGTMIFPAASISFNAIVGIACTLGQNQTVTGTKSFSSVQNFTSNLRLDGSLLVGTAGNLILTNATLQKIAYLANVTSDINATFNNYVLTTALNTTLANYVLTTALNTTLANYVLTTALTTTLNNYVLTTTLNTTLNNYVLSTALTTLLNDYVLTTALNTTLANYVLTTALNTKLNDYVLTTALTTTLNNYVLTTALNNYALNSSLDTTNNNVLAIQNKLVDIYYDVPTQYFDINHNAHIYGVLKLGLLLNVEATIDTIATLLGVTSIAAGKATSDILTINNITLPAMNLVSANLSLRIDGLETKTTNQSYNLALNTTYITGTLSLTTVRLNSLDSGLLQTANQSVVFIGETEIRNDFSVTNGFGMSCDGGIIQNNNSQNTFRGGLKVNNTLECDDFTSGGTNANINSTNTNINSTNCNISGNTIIKNMSEITSGTIPPYLSILSTKLNTNNRKFQGLVIGKEQLVNNEECNCNVGFNYAFGGFENYGYLGLNVNTNDTRECFRWYETGCSLPTGDLTVSEGGIVISSGDIKVNTINNRSTNLNINGSYALNINSNTINIGTNQGIVPPAFNTINIGNVASLSVINLNGLVYTAFPVNITGAITQWT